LNDTARANVEMLRAAQPAFTWPPSSGRVTCDAGVWRRERDGRRVAIHSRQPDREADALVETLLAEAGERPVVVVIGLGLGHVLDALERREWAGTVVALEPDPDTVVPLLERRDWSAWIRAGRLRVLVGPDYHGAADCWRLFGDGSWTPATFVNPQLAALEPEAVARATATLDRMRFDAKANADARRAFGGRYLLNTLRNITTLAHEADVSALAGAGRGVPAVLVAAGPSLDDALPSLRALRDRALLIAVDTALRPLLAAGITPHAVVAVDPSEENARHLVDLPSCEGTVLVAEGSVDPHAMSGFAGRTFLFNVSEHEPWPWLRGAGRPVGRLRAWGSVLTTAFDLALLLEADPVVFVGSDLSYSGGQPYARNVSYEEDWRRGRDWGESNARQWARAIGSRPDLHEPGVDGAAVATAPHLKAFRDWVVEQVGRTPSRTFLNATGRGLLHGPRLEQVTPDALPARLAKAVPAGLGRRLRDRHQLGEGDALMTAAHAILGAPDTQAARDLLARWAAFAPGLTEPALLGALSIGLARSRPTPVSALAAPTPRPDVAVDDAALRALASGTTLVPMVMPAHRLLSTASGHRVFRFRTQAARLASCVVRSWTSAVLEDGQPMARADDVVTVPPGGSVFFRGEVHLRPADGSDPRFNGRTYAVLVPPFVAYLEALPDDTILSHDL
jgi:hypothetical protein